MPIEKPNKPVTKKVRLKIDDLDPGNQELAREEAASIIIQETNKFLDRSQTPVEGGRFKSTLKDGRPSKLFETGAMRFNLSFEDLDNGIEVGVFASDQTPKAYAHNTSYKGHPFIKSKDLFRQFIPAPNKRYKEEIMKKVNDRIESIRINQPRTIGEILELMEKEL